LGFEKSVVALILSASYFFFPFFGAIIIAPFEINFPFFLDPRLIGPRRLADKGSYL
jgi:hypothetical protein